MAWTLAAALTDTVAGARRNSRASRRRRARAAFVGVREGNFIVGNLAAQVLGEGAAARPRSTRLWTGDTLVRGRVGATGLRGDGRLTRRRDGNRWKDRGPTREVNRKKRGPAGAKSEGRFFLPSPPALRGRGDGGEGAAPRRGEGLPRHPRPASPDTGAG